MKRVTIRRGHLQVATGKLSLIGHRGQVEKVIVTRVHHTTVRALTAAEYRADGAVSAEDMLKKLHKFYPGLRLDDAVTVVFFHRE